MDWNYAAEILADIFTVGFGAFMIYIFLEILMLGSHYVGEPRRWLLILEIVMSLVAVLLALERFFRDVAP